MPRRPLLLSAVVSCDAAFLLLACAGTDTGNPIGDNRGLGDEVEVVQTLDGKDCDEAVVEVAWDETPLLGISAADVASSLSESVSEALRWEQVEGFSSLPESGRGEITVTITPLEKVYSVTPTRSSDDDGPVSEGPVTPIDDGPVDSLLGPSCGSKLRIEALIQLETSGGELAEEFITTVDASMKETIRAHFRVPLTVLNGTLGEMAGDPDTTGPDALEVEVLRTPLGMIGQLRLADTATKSADAVTDLLATFPANPPCGDYFTGFLLQGEQSLHGISPSKVSAALAKVSNAEWVMEHEDGTLRLACDVAFGPALCVGAESQVSTFPSTVSLRSDDGSLSGSFSVNVHVESDGKDLVYIGVAGGAFVQDIRDAMGLGERYAITDPAPLDSYIGAMTDFIVEVSGEPWGVFRYAGLTQADCSAVPAGQGCPGLLHHTLFGIHLGEPNKGYELE